MILITIQLTPLSNEFTAEGNNRTIDQSSKHGMRLQTLRLRQNGANRSNRILFSTFLPAQIVRVGKEGSSSLPKSNFTRK